MLEVKVQEPSLLGVKVWLSHSRLAEAVAFKVQVNVNEDDATVVFSSDGTGDGSVHGHGEANVSGTDVLSDLRGHVWIILRLVPGKGDIVALCCLVVEEFGILVCE